MGICHARSVKEGCNVTMAARECAKACRQGAGPTVAKVYGHQGGQEQSRRKRRVSEKIPYSWQRGRGEKENQETATWFHWADQGALEGCFNRFWITQLALKVVAEVQAVPVCWFCCQPTFLYTGVSPSGTVQAFPDRQRNPTGGAQAEPSRKTRPVPLLHSQPWLLQHQAVCQSLCQSKGLAWSQAGSLGAAPSSFWEEWAAAVPVPGHWVRLALAVATMALGDKEVVASWTIPRTLPGPLNQERRSIRQCRHSWPWRSPAANSVL